MVNAVLLIVFGLLALLFSIALIVEVFFIGGD